MSQDFPLVRSPSADAAPRKLDGIRVIAIFKFIKAALLIATTYGVHRLLEGTLLDRLYTWAATLNDDRLERRLLVRALEWVEGLGAKRIEIFFAVTITYTAVVLIEGIGLWLRRTWAEWLTVIATGSLIPFELWELLTRPMDKKLAILATFTLNAVIVWYLVWLLRKTQAQPHAS